MRYLCDTARHLVCEPFSIPNLHAMADELGIKRWWFHAAALPHYDIPMSRVAEIQVKCEVVSPRVILAVIKRGQQAHLLAAGQAQASHAKQARALPPTQHIAKVTAR